MKKLKRKKLNYLEEVRTMNKENVKKLAIQNQWLNSIITFLKKAKRIDDKTMEMIVEGNKPEYTEEQLKELDKAIDELLEDPKKEETSDGEVNK